MDTYDTPEYHVFVEEMAKYCCCRPPWPCPCDGLLAGGLCDGFRDEHEDLDREDREDIWQE